MVTKPVSEPPEKPNEAEFWGLLIFSFLFAMIAQNLVEWLRYVLGIAILVMWPVWWLRKLQYSQWEKAQNRAAATPTAPVEGNAVVEGVANLADLERLANLKEKGVLTEEEFQAQKRLLLGPKRF